MGVRADRSRRWPAGPLVIVLGLVGVAASPARAVAQPTGPEQVFNGAFDQGSVGWSWYGVDAAQVTGGRLCAVVPGGLVNFWDAGILQNLPLDPRADYALSFRASASVPVTIRVAVQLATEPFTPVFEPTPAVAEDQAYAYQFTSGLGTDHGQLAFQVGGSATAYTFCLDDVSLVGGEERPPYTPDTGPRVRVNQTGYLPDGPKEAVIVTEATAPIAWELHDTAGAVVASGLSTPWGSDRASGQHVHTVDFRGVTAPSSGYTLVADGQASHPFDIAADLYRDLRVDAFQFFYLQRSGLAIDGDLVGDEYARPAGHLGVPPNTGDTDVPCQANVCDHRLDARGGWYDAGDQGKYVINSGITVYQLLSLYERARTVATDGFGLADGVLRIPERGNGVPDLLDEARWGLEFMMRMQVPQGEPLAGMAHHKLHDREWTPLPTLPHLDPEPRELHPPSTAATLNLAAAGAQCARVFRPYDAGFAGQCLRSARRAYDAALANPDRYASEADSVGGGSYADGDVTDEFYWAAVELYLTTGKRAYLTDLRASPHHTGAVFDPTGFGWLHTAALGRLDLATVRSDLPVAERRRARDSVVAAAGTYLALGREQPYGVPLPAEPWAYFWGSNSNILNNLVVLATAYDLTGDVRYRDGALRGMDYILGGNALNHSYVSGWGERSPQHVHHRWYARDLDPALPPPPAGMLVGGANASLNDPHAAQLLAGCAPQRCYIDEIPSFSTNEPAINYNAALAWMATFAADQPAVPRR